MIGGHLDEDDPNPIGILDPHLGEPPGLRSGLAHDPHASRRQAVTLGVDVPHLEPDHQRTPGGAIRAA